MASMLEIDKYANAEELRDSWVIVNRIFAERKYQMDITRILCQI